MLVKCPHCNYAWKTNSKMIWITCPNCLRKIKIKKKKKKINMDKFWARSKERLQEFAKKVMLLRRKRELDKLLRKEHEDR